MTADQVWERIQRLLGQTYLYELFSIARGVSESCEQVFASAPARMPDGQPYFKVDHGLLRVIFQALGDAARVRWLVSDRPKTRSQSVLDYEIQRKRTRWLQGVLDGIPLEEVLDAKVRHSLEHFDEYLDATGIAGVRGDLAIPTVLPVDFILSHEGHFEELIPKEPVPNVYPLRAYFATERMFMNAGRRISLDALHRECRAITERVAPLLGGAAAMDERVASMTVVKDWRHDW